MGSEKRLADFIGEYSSSSDWMGSGDMEFSPCRVVLSNRRLVIAKGADDRTVIPLSSVFDVGKSNVPQELKDYVKNAVSVAYKQDGSSFIVVLKADDYALDKFRYLVYKALLNGVSVEVRHPARVGGRVVEEAGWEKTRLKVGDRALILADVVKIDVNSVYSVSVKGIEVRDSEVKVLSIDHAREEGVVATQLNIPNSRHLNIVGRYIRSEYRRISNEADSLELSGEEKKIMVGVYSGVREEQLPGMLNMGVPEVNMLLNQLMQKGIIRQTKDGVQLTNKGKVVANRKLEDVNAT